MIEVSETARILSEALPFLQRYDDQTIVVKYGGHAMVDPKLAQQFARDMVMLKVCGLNPIVVHGGGPQINRMLDKLEVKPEFREGLRVTDEATMSVVEMVLSGSINKSIVAGIQQAGGRAVGISGKDGNLDITDRAVQWLHEDYRALGTDVPVVLDSLVTQNDDVRLLADFSAGRAFGVPTTYTNSGIASRYQRRSASKTDMVTIDPGGDADMIHLAARVLGRGDVTYRPESVRLEAQSAATWEFLKRADIGDMVHIDDPTSNVRFADYSIARMSHQITPRANRGIVWSCAVEFDVEVDSMWAVTDGPAIWDETRWDKSYWS